MGTGWQRRLQEMEEKRLRADVARDLRVSRGRESGWAGNISIRRGKILGKQKLFLTAAIVELGCLSSELRIL